MRSSNICSRLYLPPGGCGMWPRAKEGYAPGYIDAWARLMGSFFSTSTKVMFYAAIFSIGLMGGAALMLWFAGERLTSLAARGYAEPGYELRDLYAQATAPSY